MNRIFSYLCLSSALLSVMVLTKLWVVPFALWFLFPQTDLVSRIYEVFIMAYGGATFLLFLVLGYFGKHVFEFDLKRHVLLHFVMQLPFAWHAFMQEVTDSSSLFGAVQAFAEGWSGLMAEPTRLLLMVYPWTDIFAILASFIFLCIGRNIEIVDEDHGWKRNKNEVKAGRV